MHRLIRRAQEFLDDSAEGTTISAFHLEAGIAFHHCTAKSYGETNWPAILLLYDKLLSIHRSPVYLLNRAIVVAEIEGPAAGIRALEEAGGNKSLKNYHLFDATLGEFYRRRAISKRPGSASRQPSRKPARHTTMPSSTVGSRDARPDAHGLKPDLR